VIFKLVKSGWPETPESLIDFTFTNAVGKSGVDDGAEPGHRADLAEDWKAFIR
jgi:hypothetical protein